MQDVRQVCGLIGAQRRAGSRLVVGIAGPPASGKSTLAEAVVSHINMADGKTGAALLPMDGYHLDNGLLGARGLLDRKGRPKLSIRGGSVTRSSACRRQTAKSFPQL